ncbi:hypothetical protein ANACOL_00782 [Anaerotruncus colihominis DSM 17241]|uniref:Uncharacterized protein n=1 Tax=Anaerotruncus colihominis DSM 17241 TaxID=445972 RepID=B0P7P7_9FIRM|nr:hypothetical protein ANACOL_00782 [Anaerotruncus colihominis DSM 17241]
MTADFARVLFWAKGADRAITNICSVSLSGAGPSEIEDYQNTSITEPAPVASDIIT